MKKIICLLAMLGGGAARADQVASPPDLPPLAEVAAAMKDSPLVKGAESTVRVERANDRRLEAGPYEFNVRMTAQERNDKIAQRKMGEWDVIVERPFRLPGKAGLDRELGQQGIANAKLAQGDSMHETGKTLLRLWFAWVKEKLQHSQWQAQAKLLKEQTGIVEKRVLAGDAPKLEISIARSALLQAEYSENQAGMRQQIAAAALDINFPQIRLPETISLSEPAPVTEPVAYWRELILQHNHAVLLARSESRRFALIAQRSREDRLPDPTLGLRYSSERGGNEQVVGGILSFSLPGQTRSAAADAALAQGEVAAQREADAVRKVSADIAANYIGARESYTSWQKSREAAAGMQHNADLISQAYSAGEANLSDLLSARRLAIEYGLAAKLAQIDAIEMRYRLMLDAHRLWPLDSDD